VSSAGPAPADLIRVHTRGPVKEDDRERAVNLLAGTFDVAPRPVLHARLEIDIEPNPANERPVVVKASVDASGRVVRAHVAQPTTSAAVDEAIARIRQGLTRLAERRDTRRHRPDSSGPGEWRHGDLPDARPEYFPRPLAEREVVRHKSYSLNPMTPEEARFEMELLGYEFHLYEDAGSGADCLIARREDGEVTLVSPNLDVGRGPAGEPCEVPIEHAPSLTLQNARSVLEGSGDRYVAYVDVESGREHVLYHRYDGHYGLLTPSNRGGGADDGANA
jgi:ribosome-associated translation inhibitor RaiA